MPAAQRREHLLDAALSVLAREGYDKVTVDAIAREAGVTRPVVYDAYGGLEPLLHALLDRSQRRALASVLKLMPTDTPTDIDDWILNACSGLIEAIQEAPDVWRPILGLTRDAPEVVRARIDSTKELIRGYISDALQTGLEMRGGPYLDTDVLSHLVIATGEHFGRLILDEPEKYTRDRLVGALDSLLTAARPQPPEPQEYMT
ncbi:MAG: TetR/AcrR family transcriptional regulator [Marmoricola sp.]